MPTILKLIAILVAAIVLGTWFRVELKKIQAKGEPMYKVYSTIPGIIIIFSLILLPIIIKIINQ